MMAALAIGNPPPRLPPLISLLSIPNHHEVPFSPIDWDPPFAFSNKNSCGTKKDVENHIMETFFQCSAATCHHDPN